MPLSGRARARKRSVFGLRPSCRRQGAVGFCGAAIGTGGHDGLVIAALPRRCPAYGVDAVLGPVLDDTGGAAGPMIVSRADGAPWPGLPTAALVGWWASRCPMSSGRACC